MPGRKPKPTYLKIVAGNPGRRPLNKSEPRPVGTLETPPDWLTEDQKAGWRYVIEHSPRGLLKRLDSAYFAESDRSFRVIVTDAGMLHG